MATIENNNDLKLRMFEIEQQVKYMDFDHLSKIKSWLDNLGDCLYLCVLHDRDIDENNKAVEPHYHIFVKMGGARSISDIARQCDIEVQQIQRIKSWKNAQAYAFHRTETSRKKYQYEADAVQFGRGIDLESIMKRADEYNRQPYIEKMLLDYGECKLSKKELFTILTAEDFHKNKKLYDNMKIYRAMHMEGRNMIVLFINGESGSGKTTLAKYIAQQQKLDYFVSGSGKDILDGYDKEECIILDDLRADSFTKSELFKLTDNNTNSSVKSRYANKDISRCKLLIITSVKTPKTLYDWSSDDEPAKQFARRLDYKLVRIGNDKEGSVYEMGLHDDLSIDESRSSFAGFNMSLVYGILHIVKQNDKVKSLLNAISDAVNSTFKGEYGPKNN